MEDNRLEVTEMARENNDAVRIPMGSDSDSSSSSDSGSVSNLDLNVNLDSDSDGDSATSEVTSTELDAFTDGQLVRVNEDDEQDHFVKQTFVDLMDTLGLRTVVETVYKNVCTSLTWQAKLRSFSTLSQSMEKIGEGFGNVKYAWLCVSRDEINNIFQYGFASRGRGIRFTPFYSPLGSVRCCVADENGLCHLLLCRVILGRSELVSPYSKQQFPSSEEFHSGVDNLLSPRVYMFWSTHMNTHVMPQYVVSFRTPVLVKEKEGVEDAAASPAIGREPKRLVPFPVLLRELAMVLPIDTIRTLQKLHRDYQEGKITKLEMVRQLRQLVGNDLLYKIIISLKRKHGAPEEATRSRVVLPEPSGLRTSSNRVMKKLRGARSA